MIRVLKIVLLVLATVVRCNAFLNPHAAAIGTLNRGCQEGEWTLSQDSTDTTIEIDDLMTMDVVIFSERNQSTKRKLGAVQDDGRITPLSVWTLEPAFANSLECLVDEEDLFPGFQRDQIEVHVIVPQNLLSYGSRQVGGGMGPGNPHGEESELLYYVDRSLLDDIEVSLKPELEIFW